MGLGTLSEPTGLSTAGFANTLLLSISIKERDFVMVLA